MIRAGVIGWGFMGQQHSKCYQGYANVELVAICDIDEKKLSGETAASGNLDTSGESLDLTRVNTYTDCDEMFAKEKLDTVSITLPTFLHKDYTVLALEAGINVLCEKPMAMDLAECDEMIAAQKKSGKVLQIGYCLHFCPEYVKAKEIVDSGEYGKLKAATMQRLSMLPTWSWDNWLLDVTRGGSELTDMHIHDSDYVIHLLGMPKAVKVNGVKGPSGGFDHAVTQYIYDDEKFIYAEGSWLMSTSFCFEGSFKLMLEKATIVFDLTRKPMLEVCPEDGERFSPEVIAGDEYGLEIEHFIKRVKGEKVDESILTLEHSKDTVKLCLAETESAENNGKEVKIK